MAQDAYLTDQALLAQNPEASDISRQRKLAEMLTLKAFEQPQGNLVSGRYVAPSWTQQLAPLVSGIAGQAMNAKLDEKQLALAEAVRGKKYEVQQQVMAKLESGDTKGALAIASKYPEYAKEFVAPLMANVIPKAQEPKVVGNRLVDPTGKVLYTAPKEYAPHAVQMIDTPQGLMQFDPNSRQLTPAMANGQPIMGSKSNLPEGANKQVTGATNLKSAIDNYKTTLEGFSTLDMANPDARANMGNAYNNMMLQAKEAYNLGVLNGPDYQILQSVVKDPTKISSLLVSKGALEKQATDLGTQADKIVENVFKTHNRNVPENLKPKALPATPNTAQQFDPALLQYMTLEQQALFAKPGK